jgi:hypothetical protein
MSEDLKTHIQHLWLTYRHYHRVSVRNGSDEKEYADASTKEFIEYLDNCKENGYNWGDYIIPIQNQIRILRGFIECYDKPIIRDKITNKTRWSL